MIPLLSSLVGSRLALGGRWRIVALAAAVALAVTLTEEHARAAEIVHVVAKGQTLGRIAKRYHTTVAILREVNDIKRGQRIQPGLALVVPEKGKEREAAQKAAAMRAGRSSKGADKDKDKTDAKGKGKGRKDQASPKSYTHKPKRPGFVRFVRGSERLETQLLTRHGRLVPAALGGVTRILRFFPTNSKLPVDPRLATLLGMVSDHFGGKTLHVVSGFRPYSPSQYTRHSNHTVGRAVDFSIEGVPNTVLRDYCRTFRNAGVGYYPNSSLVHLDARAGKVYWIDYSRPGEAPRYDSQHTQQTADEAAQDVESGSKETPTTSPQLLESTPRNPDTENLPSPSPSGVGLGSPPPVRPSDAPKPTPSTPPKSSPSDAPKSHP